MFFDIHGHVYRYPYPTPNGPNLFSTPAELAEMYNSLNIDRAVILPVVSSEMYVPQSVGEVIDICKESGGRWIPFCNVDPRVYSNTSDADIGLLLEFFREQGCKGIGEVMPNLPWNDPRFQNLLRHVERVGFPLIFDMTGRWNCSYGIYDDPGMPQLEEALNRFPDLTFIGHGPAFWAEISRLRSPADRSGYPNYPVTEGRVAQLLRTYPNLKVELSAGSGYNAMARDPEYAVRFLNEFHERIMFGTDLCYYKQPFHTCDFLIKLRDEGKISQDIFDEIAFKNAEKLLGIA